MKTPKPSRDSTLQEGPTDAEIKALLADDFVITDVYAATEADQLAADKQKDRENAGQTGDSAPRRRKHIHVHLGEDS